MYEYTPGDRVVFSNGACRVTGVVVRMETEYKNPEDPAPYCLVRLDHAFLADLESLARPHRDDTHYTRLRHIYVSAALLTPNNPVCVCGHAKSDHLRADGGEPCLFDYSCDCPGYRQRGA